MNNEIKEILDRLERIDHKEYSCGFEFADSGSFDEDCRCFEERKKLADYITNLDKKYKKSCETYQKALDETMSEKMDLEEENELLKNQMVAMIQPNVKLGIKSNGIDLGCKDE